MHILNSPINDVLETIQNIADDNLQIFIKLAHLILHIFSNIFIVIGTVSS